MPVSKYYKYLSVEGAKLSLGNGNFRFAKPSDFNDDFDMSVQSLFPIPHEEALQEMAEISVMKIIANNLENLPTAYNAPLRHQIEQMQIAIRADPAIVEEIERQIGTETSAEIYDLAHMELITSEFLSWMNEFLQGYRVLCVSSSKSSIQMWDKYTDDHKGVVLSP